MNFEKERRAVADESVSWLGTPYHHKQHVKGVGIDCVWFPIMVYRAVGRIPQDYDPGFYTRDWYLHKSIEIYIAGVRQFARQLSDREMPQLGDFAMFKLGHCASHGAIILDAGMVIHASRPNRKIEMSSILEDSELRRRLHSYWTPFT